MRLKEMVSMDVLKEFGYVLTEKNDQTGFLRFTKHYGAFLVTVCNNQFRKQIHITLIENENACIKGKAMVASIHQINKDLCEMTNRGYLDMEQPVSVAYENNWEEQMARTNPFQFLMR